MIVCKSSAELEKMYRAGQVVWGALGELQAMVKPAMEPMTIAPYLAYLNTKYGALYGL